MHENIERVLVSEEELHRINVRLGAQITRDYAGKNLLVVGILKGSVLFMADLIREIQLPCKLDFLAVSSYGGDTRSSGVVKIVKDIDIELENYDVLLVEDILDSGRTLSYVCDMLRTRHPASIRVATLLDKPERRVVDLKADYVGTSVPDEFVVGYGLDFDQRYRNLPYIGQLKRSVYEK
jgi:hypoxanthine phosphoribosyltransferase